MFQGARANKCDEFKEQMYRIDTCWIDVQAGPKYKTQKITLEVTSLEAELVQDQPIWPLRIPFQRQARLCARGLKTSVWFPHMKPPRKPPHMNGAHINRAIKAGWTRPVRHLKHTDLNLMLSMTCREVPARDKTGTKKATSDVAEPKPSATHGNTWTSAPLQHHRWHNPSTKPGTSCKHVGWLGGQ